MSTKPYVIHYNDSSYITLDLSEEDYDLLRYAISNDSRYVLLKKDALILSDVRSIIEQNEKPTEAPKAEDPLDITAEDKAWIRQQELIDEEGGDD